MQPIACTVAEEARQCGVALGECEPDGLHLDAMSRAGKVSTTSLEVNDVPRESERFQKLCLA